MLDKENLIKEKRTVEAIQKNLMGLEGKLGLISRVLGSPIVAQGGSNYECTYLEDFQESAEEEEMPTFDEDEQTLEIGYMFYGLKYGFDLEVKYLLESKRLTVHYKGIQVYLEEENSLESFVPHKEWEKIIDKLFTFVEQKQEKMVQNIKILNKQREKDIKKSIFANLRKKWGI